MHSTSRIFTSLLGLLAALPQVGCGDGGVASDSTSSATDNDSSATGTTTQEPGPWATTGDVTEGSASTTSWPTTGEVPTSSTSTTDTSTSSTSTTDDTSTTEVSTTDVSTTDVSTTDDSTTEAPVAENWLIRAAGGSLFDSVRGVELAPEGALMVAGYVMGEASDTYFFGDDDDPGQKTVPVAEASLIAGFLSRHDTGGAIAWTELVTSDKEANILGLAQVEGGVVVMGTFQGEARLGAGQAGETALQSRGAQDTFLARYDLSGLLEWAIQIGGPANELGHAVTALSDGSLAVVGYYGEGAVFGAGPTEVTLSSQGGDDLFVARYSSAGELAWVRSAGGVNNDEATGAAALADGGVVITGSFEETLSFDQVGPNQTLQSAGDRDVLTARFNADGERMWAVRAGGPDLFPGFGDRGQEVAVLADGDLLVCGEFYGPDVVFGPGEANETTLGEADDWGAGKLFFARHDADTGALEWVKATATGSPGTGWNLCNEVLPRADGGFLVLGSFIASPIFGPGEAQETKLVAAGGFDVMLASFAASGALKWARSTGGGGDDHGQELVAVDGDLVVVGSVQGPAHEEVTLSLSAGFSGALTSVGQSDGFALRFTP